ncbi:MBL fold metallo-hydrolase [Bacillus sp. JJ1533]|uniref:MBL fold metallo-hydrolase n=1 Tax=Bacillus sp. JJ1533 TaxID=3122959 RepID=UPI002FFEBFC2
MFTQISNHLFLYEDTCNVYIIRTGDSAVLIDLGSGDVLEKLPSIGVKKVTDILFTHHHRDQAQGLGKGIDGIKVWVPHHEQDLFHHVNEHWWGREFDNNYNMRQDRFSLLHSVPITGTLTDYATKVIEGVTYKIVPTPGHTTGSISILAEIDGKRCAFTGDLIYAPGKLWSLSATQWSYNGGEGIALTTLSLLDLRDRKPDVLLPSHGQIMDEPKAAMEQLVNRLSALMKVRKQNPRLFLFRDNPYEEITPHLLKNRTSMANAYVLLSESKKALFIDFGYDFIGGLAAGSDRASRRPWLYTINTLKEQYGIEKIDVVIPTHFHDDHVAGINVLRDVEGTEVWCPENFVNVMEHPKSYDLPCLWYEPIKVDKKLPLQQKIQWEEYEFTIYEHPGHTLYAAAIEFIADGKKILAIGDQYQGPDGSANYVYHNQFRIGDYVDSSNLYQTLKPDLLITGHSEPIEVTKEFLQTIGEAGRTIENLHRELLPLEELDMGADGFIAAIQPYQIFAEDPMFQIEVELKNPFPEEKTLVAKLAVPDGWHVETSEFQALVVGEESISFRTAITVPKGIQVYRERIAIDLTVGEYRFGQQAEAIVTINDQKGGAQSD